MTSLRVVGDVHGQLHHEDLIFGSSQSYLEIIAEAPCSIQVGDMGDGEVYDQLDAHVDASRHRFFPGNHDDYDRLPRHSLGDWGAARLGGVEFFFVRGAASSDKAILVRLGHEQGKTLWFEQEQLTEAQMQAAEQDYLRATPAIVFSHDAPTDIARLAWKNARRFGPPNPQAVFQPSRTNFFLMRLLERHAPRLWVFGHHHRDWRYHEGETLFVCVGELSSIDLDAAGNPRGL